MAKTTLPKAVRKEAVKRMVLAVESGTALLTREALLDLVNRLHAKRDEAVSFLKNLRVAFGIASKDFDQLWAEVEQITDRISEAEHALAQAVAMDDDTTIQRAVVARAMDFCAMVGKLSDEDAENACEVMRAGLNVQTVVREQRKAANCCMGCAGLYPDGQINSKVCNALPQCLPGPGGVPCVWIEKSMEAQ